MARTKQGERVRVVCDERLCKGFWIEYDVSEWNLGVYVDLFQRLTNHQVIATFIPRYTTAWHVKNQDGTAITHPGPGASTEAWASIWAQFDVPTSRAIFSWLWISALLAWTEAQALGPKSASDDSGNGTGSQGTADEGAG